MKKLVLVCTTRNTVPKFGFRWERRKANTIDVIPLFTLVTLNHISICVGHKACAEQLNFLIREMLGSSAESLLHGWKLN